MTTNRVRSADDIRFVAEVSVVYGAHLLDEQPRVGKMFDIENLPANLQPEHVALVRQGPWALAITEARMRM